METLIFFSFLAAVILIPIYLRSQDRARLHRTLQLAYERGQPVAPELIEALQRPAIHRGPEHDLRVGLTLSVLGLGLCGLGGGLYCGLLEVSREAAVITGASVAGLGALPGLLGLAFLSLAWFGRRAPSGDRRSAPGQ